MLDNDKNRMGYTLDNDKNRMRYKLDNDKNRMRYKLSFSGKEVTFIIQKGHDVEYQTKKKQQKSTILPHNRQNWKKREDRNEINA